MASEVPVRVHLSIIAVGAVAVSMLPGACLAQGGFLATVHPAYAHAFDLKSGSLGGWANLLVVRTKNVSVGPELGYFKLGTASVSFSYRDPTGDTILGEERHARSVWMLAATARYQLSESGGAGPYVELGSGVYGLSELLLTSAEYLDGEDIPSLHLASSSRSVHPGVSAGLGVQFSVLPQRVGVEISVRAHSVLGAGRGLFPMVALSVGVFKPFKLK
jgi:hypothetical protein